MQRYDLIVDNVSNHPLLEYRRALKPKGIYLIVGGGPSSGDWIGGLSVPLKVLSGLMQAGKLTPVIDRRYSLSETAAAIRYLEAGHARGKVVITMQ